MKQFAWKSRSTREDVRNTLEEAVCCFRSCREEGYARRIDEYYFRLVLDEAMDNAMSHGNEHDPGKSVYVSLAFCDGLVDIVVRDEGRGFHPEDIANPKDEENRMKTRGRGMHLIRSLGCARWEDNGTCLRVRLTG